MNWRVKSLLQRTCAALPYRHEAVYYALQRALGRAREHDPMIGFQEVVAMAAQLAAAGRPVHGARVMEVGTGKWLDMPIGFYLCGAASVTTFDLHRYLKSELVSDTLAFVRSNQDAVHRVFAAVARHEVLDARVAALSRISTMSELLRVANIAYPAPADAARTDLPAGSIDIHFSFTVFEHIPADVLVDILAESNRVLSPGGLAVHHIDLSDHFSHSDPRISAINFLQFSTAEWSRYAGNQFGYHNRLRAGDYRRLYAEGHHEILAWRPHLNEAGLRLLEQGFPLAPEYRDIPPEELAISQVRVLSKPLGTASRSGQSPPRYRSQA